MKKITITLGILSTTFVASQVLATPSQSNNVDNFETIRMAKPSNQILAIKPATPLKTMIAVQTGDLSSIDLPDGFIETKAVHFSQKIPPSSQIALEPQGYQAESDEYWFEVTGKQLNKGVELAISSPGALIRLSGKHVKGQFAPAAKAIDPAQIEVSQGNKRLSKAIQQTVSQEALATANIFPNSSAIKLNKKIGTGDFKLKVKQNLIADQRYIVNVKEKGSQHKLNLALPKQSYMQGESVNFTAAISSKKGDVANVANHAFVKMPSGEKQAVSFTQVNDQYQVDVPTSFLTAKRGELYELQIESKANDNGLTIRRNAKVAFSLAQPTARMQGELAMYSTKAKVNLDVASEGRYEISGLVFGTDRRGKQVPMMLSQSAYYLKPGQHDIELHFDSKIMQNSGLTAPYALKNVRLKDQSRMTIIQTL
ncbi:DUF4785 domain-containing protein [uncultured Paraglaciecola sp.]|jgi:hypothetical protein|uniref:DUF4785 domain-containing protein n=1 Tax=uncultured Paraglaciecola sp. TaxID=1765024 RepID=UPI0025CEF433|nr:DUF4785 domain-containing protein [uncultured Paraglaciecola sp.]